MKVFKIKTGNPETYKNFNDLSNSKIIVEHLIQYENEIKIGAPVFFMFGGDSTPWENGLAGICRILSLPIDLGYETAKNGKYYKLELEIIIRLSRHFTKADFIKYPETYDTGIGPSTKGERNQALGIIDNTKAISAICRAIFDSEPDTKQNLITIFGNDIIEKATNETIVLYPLKANNNKSTTETLSIPLENILEEKTEDELYKLLGKALNDEYLSAAETNQAVAGIYYFGLKYRKIILEHNLNENKIIENAPDVKESFYYELNKAKNIYLYAKEKGDIIQQKLELDTQPPQQTISFINNHDQTIFYGVPGSGKSHKIDEITKSLPEEQTIRVVFHPEYTNADFVGQILPHVENTVDYRFKAGPFSRILKKAYENPTKPYFLVIEEINRGNAAAIFGDFFQLLDRDSDGWSSYSVENLDINAFIRSNDSTYTDKYSDIPTTKEIGNTTWTENTGIRLPPNLSLLATMNTSDQNVFTLDNAFQRRWDMELVPNSCSDPTQMQAKISVKEKTITWESFQSKINEIIAEKGNESGFSSMEDKRLGCWFIKNNEDKIDSEKFANKVLKYLWDDAFKFNRSEIFIDEVKNFEELKKLFIGDKGFEIFKDINFEPQNLEENQES